MLAFPLLEIPDYVHGFVPHCTHVLAQTSSPLAVPSSITLHPFPSFSRLLLESALDLCASNNKKKFMCNRLSIKMAPWHGSWNKLQHYSSLYMNKDSIFRHSDIYWFENYFHLILKNITFVKKSLEGLMTFADWIWKSSTMRCSLPGTTNVSFKDRQTWLQISGLRLTSYVSIIKQMYRTVFWALWERESVGWFGRMALKHV